MSSANLCASVVALKCVFWVYCLLPYVHVQTQRTVYDPRSPHVCQKFITAQPGESVTGAAFPVLGA